MSKSLFGKTLFSPDMGSLYVPIESKSSPQLLIEYEAEPLTSEFFVRCSVLNEDRLPISDASIRRPGLKRHLTLNPDDNCTLQVYCAEGETYLTAKVVDIPLSQQPYNIPLVPGSVLWVDSTGKLNTLAPPPEGYYFGTDINGDVGFFKLPGLSGGVVDHGHIWNEVPTGPVDGSNRTFTLDQEPIPPDSLILSVSGVIMRQGTDYVLSGKVIEFVSGQEPDGGENVLASYSLI